MNERSDRLMKALGDIGADLIAKAAPVFPEAPDTSEHGNIIAVTPYEPEIQLTKRDIRIYWITRILGAAAAIAIIGTGVFLLWKNWDKIAVKEPYRPGIVTTVTNDTTSPDTAEPDIVDCFGQITDTSMPLPFEHYDSRYNSIFHDLWINKFTTISNKLLELSDNDKDLELMNKLCETRCETPYTLDGNDGIMNLYWWMKELDVSVDEVCRAIEKNNEYYRTREDFNDIIYTIKELAAIQSGDRKTIAETFASEYCIIVGENVFSPKWLYYHTIEDYKAVGIHPETITQNMAMYEGLGLTGEAWAAFKAKLESYIIRGKTIPDDMLGEWSVEKVTENAFSEQEFGADNLESVNKMLESLGNEEVAALYKQAYALRTLTERDYEDFANSELLKKIYGDDYGTDPERAVLIDINGRAYACNSGFLWDSVVNGFKSVFTEKYADELFAGLPGDQYHYGKELYYSGVTSTLRVMLYPEYTVLKNTTDEIVIRETCYNIDYETRKVTDEVRYVNENRFVKTSDGWKCAYFGIIDKDKITQ